VLLLACGDVRNALTSAAALKQLQGTQPVTKPTKVKPQQLRQQQRQQEQLPQIELHLNDVSDVMLARDVVLLSISCSIDPSCADDLQYLWGVWFNAALSQSHKQRLDQLLQQVSTDPYPPSLCGCTAHDAATLWHELPPSRLVW